MTPYYQHAGVTIYHGDCRAIMPHLPSVDATITDPPYGVNLGKHQGAKEKRGAFLSKQGYASYEDTPRNLRNIVVPATRMALAMAKRGVVFCAGHMIWEFPRANAVGGIYLPAALGRNVWGFASLVHLLLYGVSPTLATGAGCRAIAMASGESGDANGHPCAKPITWMRWVVGMASLRGETILDPFMGSGTTLIAAKNLARHAIGIEIEEKYCEIAAKRLSQDVLDFADDAMATPPELEPFQMEFLELTT